MRLIPKPCDRFRTCAQLNLIVCTSRYMFNFFLVHILSPIAQYLIYLVLVLNAYFLLTNRWG